MKKHAWCVVHKYSWAWHVDLSFFSKNDDRYKVLEGIIYYKYRIYLVPSLSLKEEILKKAHDSPLVGHPGFFKT